MRHTQPPRIVRGAIKVPGSFTWIAWPPRTSARVRVQAFLSAGTWLSKGTDLPLRGTFVATKIEPSAVVRGVPGTIVDPSKTGQVAAVRATAKHVVLPVELQFEAKALRDQIKAWAAHHPDEPPEVAMARWAPEIVTLLRNQPAVPDPTRLGVRRLVGRWAIDDTNSTSMPYHLLLSWGSLDVLQQVLGADPESTRGLWLDVQLTLVPGVLAVWALNRPRGKGARGVFVMPVLRSTYYFATRLCQRAARDRDLQQAIARCLKDDGYEDAWSRPGGVRDVALALTDRSLGEALKRVGLTALAMRDPHDADVDLSPEKSFRDGMVRASEHVDLTQVSRTWEARLLGPPGQVAREFDF